MNPLDIWQTLTQDYAPLLPTAHSLVWVRHALWSLVLAALGLLVVARWARGPALLRRLPWVLALWAWVPGVWGVSYWLGLSFQIPSLTSAFLALAVVLGGGPRQGAWLRARAPERWNWTVLWALVALALGAALMLDTFAVFPFSLYSWGFSPTALALAWACALLPWVVSGQLAWRQAGVWPLCAALVVFTLTHWPTGNVWDAVLDPWLWLMSMGWALRMRWRRA